MDDTAVANMALAAIGTRSSIANLAEASTEAYNVNLIYEQTLNELLRKIRWNFARYETALAAAAAAQGTPENANGTTLPIPPLPWLYAYQYPGDCSFPRFILPMATVNTLPGVPLYAGQATAPRIVGGRRWIKFQVGGVYAKDGSPTKVILCNQPQAVLVYTARIVNPNIWDELFVCAFIGRLAQKLVIPCSGDKGLAKIAIEAGRAAEDEAATCNGNEDVTISDVTPDWILARGVADDFADAFHDLND